MDPGRKPLRKGKPMKPWGFRRWTRHSLILTFAGLMYIGIGIGFLNAPPLVEQDPSLHVALIWVTVDQWGFIYIGCGVLAMISAIWPQFSDKWGYVLLTGLSSAWAAFYCLAVIFYGAPLLS